MDQPKTKLLEGDFHNGDFSYNLDMELEQRLRTLIQKQLSLLEQKTRHSVEWSQFAHIHVTSLFGKQDDTWRYKSESR